MKFLLFNIAVLIALAYLFFDNGQMQKITVEAQKSSIDIIEKLKTLSKPLRVKFNETSQSKIKYELNNSSLDENNPISPETSHTLKKNNQTTKTLNEETETSNKLPPLPEPAFVAERENPSPQKPNFQGGTNKTTDKKKDISGFKMKGNQEFMSRKERRKELQKLAPSAEDLFINRMTK